MFKLASLILVCHLHFVLSQEAADKTVSLTLKSTHNGQLFYVELEAGRAETLQTFKLLLATDFAVTWISSDIYKNVAIDEYEGTSYGLSFTGSVLGYNKFIVHNDSLKIGSKTIEKQQFGVAYNAGEFRDIPDIPNINGIFGLNDGVSHPEGVVYPFQNLFKLNYIDHMKYSVYVNNSVPTDDDQPVGSLILGGVDKKYYTGQLNYVKLYEDKIEASLNNRTIIISDIRLDWSRAHRDETLNWIGDYQKYSLKSEPMRLKLDSSTILFAGEKEFLDKCHLDIMGAKSILNRGIYAFNDCRLDNKPDFVFSLLGGFEVTITPEDYVIEHQLYDRKVCLSAFKPCLGDLWLFGTKFLRKYYTVFDYENDVVGFATPSG